MMKLSNALTPIWLLVVAIAVTADDAPAADSDSPTALDAGPVVQHLSPTEVAIRWEHKEATEATVVYYLADAPPQQAKSIRVSSGQSVTLSGLRRDQDYAFRVRWIDSQGHTRISPTYGFDTSCDLDPVDVPTEDASDSAGPEARRIREAAEHILNRSGVDRGYCLVLGCETGRLALELARRSNLRIIGVEPDATKVAAARRMLDAAGVYGTRVTIDHGPLDDLPYANCFANLIVSERSLLSSELPSSVAEVCRVLRPYGGVAYFSLPKSDDAAIRAASWLKTSPLSGWKIERGERLSAVLRRGPLPGAGQWSHLYADSGNSACSNDDLSGPMDLQWFGRPGPRQMVDRHHRGMAPLSVAGRLFVAGNDRLKAVDAYNGTPLWDLTVPGSRRVVVHRDCGQLVATEDLVYLVSGDTCLALDSATGRWAETLRAPGNDGGNDQNWGYLASVGDSLFGSTQKPGASYAEHARYMAEKYTHWDNVPMVTSEALFCLDRHDGQERWTYRREGGSAILNSTIAADRGRLYFVESRNPAALANEDGRVTLGVALGGGDCHLVAVDQQTGDVAWQRPVDLSAWRHAIYLGVARGTIVLTGTFDQANHPRYDLLAFHAADGKPKWATHYLRTDKPAGGSHGEQDQHPVVIGGTIFSRPVAIDLETGKSVSFNLDRGGHGCGTLSGSASYLFGRGGNPRMYPIDGGGRSSTPLTTVSRPGCWINVIPAGGLLLIPESSSGCSCAFAVQTSIALAPRSVAPADQSDGRDNNESVPSP